MNIEDCFKRRDIDKINTQDIHFHKSLSLIEIIFIGIGMIVGAGIFVLTGITAGLYTGPAVIISFIISSIICMCAGLCYAEFASMIKNGGNSYSYLQISLGELPAWLVGMLTVTGYFLGTISVISGWGKYLLNFLVDININTPLFFRKEIAIYFENEIFHYLPNLPSLLIIFIATLILYYGMQLSSLMTSFFVIIKIITLVSFIIIGTFYIDYKNWIPFIPPNTGKWGEFGISGIFMGSSILFVSYNGIDAVCSVAQDTKNPSRNIPISIIVTIFIVSLIYILTSIVLTGLVNYRELSTVESFVVASKKIGLNGFKYFIGIGSLAGLSSSILISLYTIIRILTSISNDGLLPNFLFAINKKNKTPNRLTLITVTLLTCSTTIFDINSIISFSSIFIMISLISVCSASIYMRYKFPNIKRRFKYPLNPFMPLVVIFTSLYIIFNNELQVLINTILFIILLVIFYFIFKIYKKTKHYT